MCEEFPTNYDLQALTAYLPILYAPGFQSITGWTQGGFPAPIYHPAVTHFFALAGQEQWMDHAYSPQQAAEMVADLVCIQSASVEEIKTLLTWCVRGERFCDGHWGKIIEDGTIRRILERLCVINDPHNNGW